MQKQYSCSEAYVMLYVESLSIEQGTLIFYLQSVICRFSVEQLVKSAARGAFVFSRENDACSKHVKVLLFKCKASCTGQIEGKAFTVAGTAVQRGIIILNTRASCSTLRGSMVLHCPLLGLSHGARTKGDLDAHKFALFGVFAFFFSPQAMS